MRRRNPCLVTLFLATMLLVFSTWEASGGEFSIVPSMTVREAYNSNVFLSVVDREGAFVTTLSPALETTGRTERLEASLTARLDSVLYAGISSQDSLDQYYNGQFRYRPTERLSLMAGADYTLNSQPDRSLEATGLAENAGMSTLQKYTIGGMYPLSEKGSANLSYVYSQIDYQGQPLSDYRTHTAILLLSRELGSDSAMTRATVQFQFDRDLFPLSTVENYALTLGANRSFNEIWSILVTLGGRYTQSEVSAATIRKTSQDWGGTGRLALACGKESTSGNFSFYSEFQPATSSNVSGATQRTGVQTDIRNNFTAELSGSMSLSYILNRSILGEGGPSSIDEDTLSITSGLRYEFTKDMALDASYRYTRIMYNNTGQVADRNLISLNILIRYPMFL